MSSIFYTDEGSGLPIIFIHGFCETHELWSDFISPFLRTNRVITFDLPGFGQSLLSPGAQTLDSIGLTIIKWLRKIGISKAIFVGHSMGGYVALSIANQNPGIVTGLCLFHSSVLADTNEKLASRTRVNEFVRKYGVAPYIRTYVSGLFSQKDHPAISRIYELGIKTDLKTLIFYSNLMKNRSETSLILKESRCPVMIIAGRNDTIISLEDLQEQVTFPSNCEFIILENSAHLGMIEEEKLAREVLLKFVHKCNSAI